MAPGPMPPSPRPSFGQYQFIISAMVNSITAIYNGEQSRKQQERLAAENRIVAAEAERNRQNFQREVNAENALRQKELSELNHLLRIQEQENNFRLICQQAEWNHFLQNWPLVNLPSVIRQEQLLSDNTIALRVIFSKSSEPIFNQVVYPKVEQALREFTELYYTRFQSKNLIFYHNAFKANVSGGGVDKNIHHALRDLPVIIIDANVLFDEIVVSFTMWDMGIQDDANIANTIFRLPYEKRLTSDGKYVTAYYLAIAKRMAAYLKYVLGYAYDGYNLIHYNRPPLLPRVANLELEEHRYAPMLGEETVCKQMTKDYGDLYTDVIGTGNQACAQLPNSFKQLILHKLRIEYAEAVKSTVPEEQFIQYLNESLNAWVDLRSTLPAEAFLEDILSDSLPVEKYFTKEDKEYFERLNGLYEGKDTPYSDYISRICSKLETVDLREAPKTISSGADIIPAKPQVANKSHRKIPM